MAKLPLFDMSGKSVGDLDLKDEVFGAEYNQTLIHQIFVGIQANRRHGTHDTKTRGEVRGGGRKPWRQKGTGMARHGSRRSPIWKGGGITWGPHPRKYTQTLPKKMRREALRSALSQRVRESAVSAVSELSMSEFKTKKIVAMLQAITKDSGASTKTRTLLLIDAPNKMVEKSAANIPGVTVVLAQNVNVVDVVLTHQVLATQAALKKIEEVLS